MARLSELIRNGESALDKPAPTGQAEDASAPGAAATEPKVEGGAFSELPPTPPPPDKMRDFPILSQIANEVGTVATVVDKIDLISAFIQRYSGGEVPPPAPSEQAQPQPAPGAHAPQPGQAPPAHPAPTPAQPAQTPAQPPPAPEPEPAALSEEEIEGLYDHLHQFVQGAMSAAQADEGFSVDQAFLSIAKIIDTPGAPDVLYRKAIYTRESEDVHAFASAVVVHSVNVAIYAIKIGEGLNYNRDQLIDLGVAALLHDVGMVSLPLDFFEKQQLTKQDIEVLHQHPFKGHEILSKLGDSFSWLADIAMQEHEREDGSGYPEGLRGNEVHPYAKVVGVADVYAGLTRSRPSRRGLLPFEAVKEVLQSHKPKFDGKVIRILLGKLSAFPIGSMVQLNSGAVGTVVETDEAYPLRPAIRILYDAQGRNVSDDRVIQLREFPILHISDAIYEEDMATH